MAGPYFMLPSPGGKCGRAPWGRQPPAPPRQAGSERAAPAPPAQPRAQGRSSRRAARPGPRGRPRQAHGPRSPGAALAPASLFFCFHGKGRSKKKREMIKLLEAGCWRSLEAEQGRARARGGRWKLPPRRPGGGEEKEGFGGNEGDLKSRPAAALHLPPPRAGPPSAAPCCPLPAAARDTASAGPPRPRWDTSPLLLVKMGKQIHRNKGSPKAAQ